MRGLTKTAALELARDNIRGNSIHPGAIRTTMAAEPDAAAMIAASVKELAIPRIAEPDEITRLALFVASDDARFSTGSEFIAGRRAAARPGAGVTPRFAGAVAEAIDAGRPYPRMVFEGR